MKYCGTPIVFAALLFLSSCKTQLPDFTHLATTKIAIAPGPEDIAIDTLTSSPRLLVACAERRKGSHERDGIYVLDLATEKVVLLKRLSEPENLILRPHGIDLVTGKDGMRRLYVVSHSPAPEGKIEHQVVIYVLEENGLRYEKSLMDELLISPNDVSALPDGHVYISNDSGRRSKIGKAMERLFQTRSANVVEYDGKGNWSVAVDELSYANGVLADEETVIVAPTMKKEVVIHDFVTNESRKIDAPNGLDNIHPVGPNEILVPAHPNFFAFIKHAKEATKKSPGIIYKVDLDSGNTEVIYADDGSQISANSSALIYNNKLYIAQVFDPFILKVILDE